MRRRLINKEAPKRQNALLEQPKRRLVIRRVTPNEKAVQSRVFSSAQPLKMRKLGTGQNQGIAWSSDSSLWGNQILQMRKLSGRQNLGIVWSSDTSLWGN